jgi:Carboxypeptidase regulatory-like domain/TonB dependent receptor-like, beta-barrel
MLHVCSYCLYPIFRFLTLVVLLLLILFFGAVSANAQDASTGAFRGTVSDSAGARISGATVALVNASTGLQYSTTSNQQGEFVFDLLPPGDYHARAEFTQMSPQLSPLLHVDVGGVIVLDFQLPLAGAKESMTVSGAPQMIETQPSAVSALIEEKTIEGLPLNGRRFTDLALLAPGVTTDPRGLTSSSNGDLAFGGVRGYQSSYLVDGADNNNGFFSQARGRYRAPYQFSNEVVQEFRVSSNAYGAELGRAGGAVINVITKTGSNHLHGSAFYFLRDSALNARHPFVDVKPHDQQQQFGFTLGGPLKRNRAFFFAGFDQHIFHVPIIVRFLDGSSTLVPKKGAEPLHHGDYEESDKDLVFAAADQLNSMAGEFGSSLLGNAGFLKVDLSLTPKHYLSARLSSSRYYGTNNVFFDPASPITTFAVSENGEENVKTESVSVALTSSLSWRLTSHLRAQFSRDLQQSFSNSSIPQTRIYDVFDGFGRSSILPRKTPENRYHLAETLSLESSRHSWKFGGDVLLSRTYNFFPSLFGGEYIFDTMRVDPWTFTPMRYGMQITPLRAYAHQVPRYYIQNFGSAESNPNSNEYSGFTQDTIRLWSRLAVSLGVRYDVQSFSTNGLQTNPLWPDSGKVPSDHNNFAPRIGLAYSIGTVHPLVIRAGYGMFYTRIPQIFVSAVETDNGLSSTHLFLDNTDYLDHKLFPTYPSPLVACALNAVSCMGSEQIASRLTSEISAFAHDFQTPKVEQASLNVERELTHRLAAGVSYLYVHGEGLIRTRDVNLPIPQQVTYPVYDDSGINLLGMYDVDSFSTWQSTRSLTCPFPPCINPLNRPIAQLGAINVFESAASSIYQGMTVSVRRRMTHGVYFRMGYTFAHAIDDGQNALLTSGSTVQNTYSPQSERGSSATDQRHRLVFSWIAEPQPFHRSHEWLGRMFNDWRFAGVYTLGSGRPLDARIFGDPNQDLNDINDRLPGYGRNAFLGPDYATTDVRLSRLVYINSSLKLELLAEFFNMLNRNNKRVDITDDAFVDTAGQFIQMDKRIGNNYFPASYQKPANFLQATNAYAPRQIQFALRLIF